MSEEDDFRRTIAFGETAIGYLRANEVPAYPRHYELWYTYASGINQALNRAINDILTTRGSITAREVAKIFDEYISPTRMGERIEEIGERIGSELAHTLRTISATVDSTTTYCAELNQSQTALTGTIDQATIEAIVRRVVDATQRTESINRGLAQQLDASRRQIAELQLGLEAVRFESLTDELTTLANRRHFDHSMVRAQNESELTGEPFSLIMVDIDHFKKFNDTYGHQTGDQVLRLVAIGLKQNVKGQDIACRYGGEEFGVILPRTGLRQAAILAEHIRQSVMAKELVKRSTGENLGRITVSLGVASWSRGDVVGDILARADAALYAAKRGGRNLVRCETDPDVVVERVA